MDCVNDAKKACFIIEEEYGYARNISSHLGRVYFQTNEYLDFFDNFDLNDKSVLTVCASGDQAFFSLIAGASAVDTFDSNPGQYYITELKKAAILGLNKKGFLDYFPLVGGDLSKNYHRMYYDVFKSYLCDDSRYFWNKVYSLGEQPPIYLLKNFSYSQYFQSDYTRFYEQLKKRLQEQSISFKNLDIRNIKNISQSYDFIYLSNIYDHLNNFCGWNEKEYLDFVNNDVMPMLNDNGICVFHYQKSNMEKSFKKDNFETIHCGYGDNIKVLRK